ncbi:UNVERIFIED_ORG: 5-methylcytosine-specific restriction endonuclease McrA [Rhizobium nepotum]|nr:5-methylcytosine-specific restriction endonuclease McrA [Rhizobium nepotum]
MPSRAPSVCGHCGRAHAPGESCAAMARMARERKARFDQKRPHARARGYDREWEREAKAYLSRPENQFCQCGAKAVVVRHIKSIRLRPELRMDQSNWRPGCQRCNALDAAEERRNTQRKPK